MQTIPTILRADANRATNPLRGRDVVPPVILAGGLYGAVMGSSGGWNHVHWLQIIYSALKVPLLLGVSFVLTVPGFFMLNTLFGLRGDFRNAIRAVVTAQAGLAITLASLAPFVAMFYASCTDYQWAILFNGGMFAVATAAGQVLLRRYFRRLIATNPRHRLLLRVWVVAHAFVAIQMAWVLRPFIGGHGEATTFFRQGAWGNAYVVLWEILK
jgi:hypothetical protein